MSSVELVETSLRHGQQALLLSRLRQRHALVSIALLDQCGFAAIDAFGGATFEAQLRFLGEDPFARLRTLREAAPKTPLLASLAGQALVGHRHYPDDVVQAFIACAAQCGIDIFRLFDPLNDVANLTTAAKAAHDAGKEAEGVIVYTPGATKDFAAVAKQLKKLGCVRLHLWDPIGALTVTTMRNVVKEMQAAALPISVGATAQTGQAEYVYSAALGAGVSRLDTCLAPLSGGTSYPATEALVSALAKTKHGPKLSLEPIIQAGEKLEMSLYADLLDPFAAKIETSALTGDVPLTAMGHALIELRERNAMDRIDEVEREIVRVRSDLGDPPLASPIVEIIATQAVYNVCDGDRYATISQEVNDYCLGLYGNPPKSMDKNVRRTVNGRNEPIDVRPADLLDPGLPRARELLQEHGIEPTEEALICAALFPSEYIAFSKGEITVERLADEPRVVAQSMDVVQQEPVVDFEPAAPTPTASRDLTVEVDGQSYDVRVFGMGAAVVNDVAVSTSAAATKPAIREGTIVAPMQGLIVKLNVGVGDTVAAGDVVAVLEAMKMQNDITAPKGGPVADVHVKQGDVVSPNSPVLTIG